MDHRQIRKQISKDLGVNLLTDLWEDIVQVEIHVQQPLLRWLPIEIQSHSHFPGPGGDGDLHEHLVHRHVEEFRLDPIPWSNLVPCGGLP